MLKFNKNSILLKIVSIIVTLILIIGICIAVSNKLSEDTVVIINEEDNKKEQSSAEVNEEFNIKNIYKYKTKDAFEQINYGWIDNDNYITLENQKSFCKKDYRYTFSHELCKGNYILEGEISPDGSKLAYVELNNGVKEIYVLNINEEKTKRVFTMEADKSSGTLTLSAKNAQDVYISSKTRLKWSSEGRYLELMMQNSENEYSLFIYDTYKGSTSERKITLPGMVEDFCVFNNGSRMSVLYYSDKAYYLYDINMQSENLLVEQHNSVKIADYLILSYHLSEDSLVYLDNNYTLYKYTKKMKKSIKIAQNITKFGMSNDLKYIVYTRYGIQNIDIYVGKLTNMGITDQKSIYKNSLKSSYMKWSPDNMKILIETYDYINIGGYVENYSADNGKSIVIIEFDEK